MAKRVLPDYYSFNPATRTIIIPNKIVSPEQLLLITNVSSNTVIFNFSDPDLYATSYVMPFSSLTVGSTVTSQGTKIVLNYNTASMGTSDALSILIDEIAEVFTPSELLTDNTGKFRTSSPKSLIDTDFEYGLQPIKWEAFSRYQNIPAYYVRAGATAFNVTSITGTGGVVGSGVNGRSLITVDTQYPHNLTTGDIVTVFNTQNALSSNCEGAFPVSSVSIYRFTYFAKGVANGNLYSSSIQVNGGAVIDNNNQTTRIVHDQMYWANPSVTTDGYVTVTTTGKHNLFPGTPIMIASSTTTSANGNFYVYDVPTPTSFRYRTVTPQGDVFLAGSSSGIINTANTIILVRPEASFIHRPSDGGVQINTNIQAPGITAIRQTRRYFRYQSGKGIQFSTGTKVAPHYDINTISSAGTSVAVATTFQTPTFGTGCTIVVEGVQTNAGTTNYYNGTFQVSSVVTTSNIVTWNMAGNPTDLTPGAQTGSSPQITVKNWRGAVIRIGFFDDTNGFFFEFDGQFWYAVQRRSTNECMGTVNVVNGSTTITGVNTKFGKQLTPQDVVVIKGQVYEIVSVDTDNSAQIAPHYRGITSNGARMNLVQEVRVPQSAWNLDKCDGTGPSGYVIDQTKMQMFYIDYTWYGAGFIRWGFRGPDGNVFYCHKQANNNINNQAYMRSGNLPARYEVSNGLPYTRFISASTTANGITLGGTDTTFVVKDATYWPSSGTIHVTQLTSSEVMTYTGKSYNSTLNGWQLTGITRNQLGGDTSIAKRFYPLEFDGGTAGYSSVCGVSYITCDNAPVVMHWGSSVIMDGGYDEDRSISFAYTRQAGQTIVNANTSIAVLSIRLGPTVDNGVIGALGAKEIINRMQLQTKSLGIQTNYSVQVLGILNGTFTSTTFSASVPTLPVAWGITSVVQTIGAGSLAQIIDHTSNTTLIGGGEQVFGFVTGIGTADNYDISQVRDLGNSLFGGDGSNKTPGFPVGPDVLTIVLRNTSSTAVNVGNIRLSWTEAQA